MRTPNEYENREQTRGFPSLWAKKFKNYAALTSEGVKVTSLGGLEGYFHEFLTSALDGDDWSASRPGLFNPWLYCVLFSSQCLWLILLDIQSVEPWATVWVPPRATCSISRSPTDQIHATPASDGS